MLDQECEYHKYLLQMDKLDAISKDLNRKNELAKQKHKERFYDWLEKPEPVPQSEQNKEWEFNRPDGKYLQYISVEWRRNTRYDSTRKNIRRFNRKHTNDLGSHHGESRNSRADKMSGYLRNQDYWRDCRAGIKRHFKKFYTAKRRMFLNNPNNWEKI